MTGSLYSPAVPEFFIVCGCLTCKPDPRNEHTFDRDTGKATHTQSYPFQLLSAADVLQDSVNLLFNATSPVHDPTQHTQQNHHTMENVSGYVCNHGSPSGERDTASPRGRYGERPQRDSV